MVCGRAEKPKNTSASEKKDRQFTLQGAVVSDFSQDALQAAKGPR